MTVSSSVPSDGAVSSSRSTAPLHKRIPVAVWAGVVFLIAHLPLLAPSLEDYDSVNFGLALHDYDIGRSQPHPPGYPVYIAAGRLFLSLVYAVRPDLDAIRADGIALSLLSAVMGAVAVASAWWLFSLVNGIGNRTSSSAASRSRAALWSVMVLAAAPLFWISGLRPMSDMPGLALTLVAQALLLFSALHAGDGDRRRAKRAAVAGALIMGVAIGVRSQVVWLTAPMLLVALVAGRVNGVVWLITRPCAALIAGVLAWAVPMVASVGGMSQYLAALGAQAGGDFAFVDMLWLDPTVRHLVRAVRDTVIAPWSVPPLAYVVLVLALAGGVLAALHRRSALALVLAVFGPYALFHLLLQETLTIRYALPLLVPVAYFAGLALDAARGWAAVAAGVVTAAALAVSVPPSVAYGAEGHPAFRALQDMLVASRRSMPGGVFAHHALGRTLEVPAAKSLPVTESRLRYEWLGPVEYWRGGGTRPIWFLAEPGRMDLTLFDPQSRLDVTQYRWPVAGRREFGGTRPINADWYRIPPPGWFAGRGWSLSLEAGGVTVADQVGLDRRPIEAYVRRRREPVWMLVGGRDLAAPSSRPSIIDLAIDGRQIESWRLDPAAGANFLRVISLPQGIADGPGAYATLTITARADGEGPPPPIAIRQFDLQTAPTLMYGFADGWHEEEYEASSGKRWRWTSDRSVLQVVPPQAVELRMHGESPRRYFDSPPTVRVLAGTREIAVLRPDDDFEWRVPVPGDAVQSAGGAVTIEVDRVYLPGQVEGTSDARRLGLRLFDVGLYPLLH